MEDRLGNPIYSDYRNMVMVESLFSDSEREDTSVWEDALMWLYGSETQPEHGSLQELLQELVWFYSGERVQGEEKTKGPELISFEQDAEFIHADFLCAYGIDLAEIEYMHWWKFLSLMRALPEDTAMAKRMYYRGVKLDNFKGEERKRIAKLQKMLRIRKSGYTTPEEKERNHRDRLRARAKAVLK